MRRKLISATAALACLCATASHAQDASQWTGFYAGLTAAKGSADQEYSTVNTFELEGNGPGLFVGYNYATGAWVLGGELAYSQVAIGQTNGKPYKFESFFDLKGRAGYATGNALFYGTLGATVTDWRETVPGYHGDGLLYGIGIDYLISPKFVVGAEYTVRNVTSDWNTSTPPDTFDADVRVFALRAAYKF